MAHLRSHALRIPLPARSPERAAQLSRVTYPAGTIDAFSVRPTMEGSQPRFHDDYLVCVAESGTARLHLRGRTVPVGPSDVVGLAPGTVHSWSPQPSGGCSLLLLHCGADVSRAAVASAAGDVDLPTGGGAIIADGTLAHRLVSFFGVSAFERRADIDSQSALATLGTALGQMVRSSMPDGTEPRSDAVCRTLRHLDSQFSTRIRISHLADCLGVSVFQLIRAFRREIGLPPYAYLRQVRVNRALGMIRGGEPITGAAYSCGFSDQSHLTRAFKQLIGLPPGAYTRAGRVTGEGHMALTG